MQCTAIIVWNLINDKNDAQISKGKNLYFMVQIYSFIIWFLHANFMGIYKTPQKKTSTLQMPKLWP